MKNILLACLALSIISCSRKPAVLAWQSPAGPGSQTPYLFSSNETLYLSWFEKNIDGKYSLVFSRHDGKTWSAPRVIAQGRPFMVNWADFPSIKVLENGSLVAHWMELSGGKQWYDYDVHISVSKDDGITWNAPLTPHRDGSKSEHGFVSIVPLDKDRFTAVWLDGRKPHVQSLYASDFDGRSFGPEKLLDPRVCDCCQTAAVRTSEGVLAIYRDRSEKEIRDMSVVRISPTEISPPRTLHADGWQIKGCPVNGPAADSRGNHVAVAWFTSDNKIGKIFGAFSQDRGKTFGTAVRLDEGDATGRVDARLLEDGSAAVSWYERSSGDGKNKGRLLVRRLLPDGSRGPAKTVAETDVSRQGGCPRMARNGSQLVIAWTEASGNFTQVRLASLETNRL